MSLRTHGRTAMIAAGLTAAATLLGTSAAWAGELPGFGPDPAALQDRLHEIGGGLQLLADDPHAALDLERAVQSGDSDGFLGRLRELGLEPPADQCDPYVTVYVTALTGGWKAGDALPVLEIRKFVRGVCPPGTYGLSRP